MQKLQNNAVRLINPYQQNIRKLYTDLEILNMRESIYTENCKMTHRLEHGMLLGKLPQLFNIDNKGRSLVKAHRYRTRTKNIPNLASMQTMQYRNSFFCKSITDYQTIPVEIRQVKNTKTFSKKMKRLVLS